MADDLTSSGAKVFAAHPVLLVSDLERTIDYYQAVLGFRRFFHLPGETGAVECGDAEIHFWLVKDCQPQPLRGQTRHTTSNVGSLVDVRIVVEGIDLIYAELDTRGAKIIQPVATFAEGIRYCVVEDNNGYWLNYSQRHL